MLAVDAQSVRCCFRLVAACSEQRTLDDDDAVDLVASGRAVTSPLETHGARSLMEDGAGRAAVRRLRTPVSKERYARSLHANPGGVGIGLLADEARTADRWQREDVPATRAAEPGDAAARRDGARRGLTRGTRGTRSPARTAGIDTAGGGDRRTPAAPTARRASLVGTRADATADAAGIRAARPDAGADGPGQQFGAPVASRHTHA